MSRVRLLLPLALLSLLLVGAAPRPAYLRGAALVGPGDDVVIGTVPSDGVILALDLVARTAPTAGELQVLVYAGQTLIAGSAVHSLTAPGERHTLPIDGALRGGQVLRAVGVSPDGSDGGEAMVEVAILQGPAGSL